MIEKKIWHAPTLSRLSVAPKTESYYGVGADGGSFDYTAFS